MLMELDLKCTFLLLNKIVIVIIDAIIMFAGFFYYHVPKNQGIPQDVLLGVHIRHALQIFEAQYCKWNQSRWINFNVRSKLGLTVKLYFNDCKKPVNYFVDKPSSINHFHAQRYVTLRQNLPFTTQVCASIIKLFLFLPIHGWYAHPM